MTNPICTMPPPEQDPALISVEFPESLPPATVAIPQRVLREYRLVSTQTGKVLCTESRTRYDSVVENRELKRLGRPLRWLRQD